MKNNTLCILLLMTSILLSCGKERELKLLSGGYSGYYYYNKGDTQYATKSVSPVNLDLQASGQYYSTGNPDRIPAGGEGNFTINRKNTSIEFEEKNTWTSDFDPQLILNGRFDYEVKGDSLILTRYRASCPQCSMLPSFYQYRLKRVN